MRKIYRWYAVVTLADRAKSVRLKEADKSGLIARSVVRTRRIKCMDSDVKAGLEQKCSMILSPAESGPYHEIASS